MLFDWTFLKKNDNVLAYCLAFNVIKIKICVSEKLDASASWIFFYYMCTF